MSKSKEFNTEFESLEIGICLGQLDKLEIRN